jgi:hypothetical protein
MQSPFPGMDPYIEACELWEDFHGHLIEKIFDEVSAALPPGYVAQSGKRSYILLVESENKTERSFIPDVKVTQARPRRPAGAGTATAEATEPLSLRAFIETEFVERFIDIYEKPPRRRLVTSIEVLSPSNKRRGTKGWRKYLRKRQALLLGKANLVEIDLVRGGTRMPMLDPLPDSPYYLLVAREEWAPTCRVWPAFFDRPLPPIPIPLSKPDHDIPLAIQPLIDAIYQRARYREQLDYSKQLAPPLTPEQTAWLARQLSGEARATRPRPPRTRRRR